MSKLVLADLSNLANETSAVATLNGNNDLLETAFENTLSRDGTSPNQMQSHFDMNGYSILNVGDPTGPSDLITQSGAEDLLTTIFDANIGDLIDEANRGDDAWSPVFAAAADGDRRVLQVIDWTEGEGPKPDTGYVGSSGLVASAALATDIRGQIGITGPGSGDMLSENNLSDVDSIEVARSNLGLNTGALAPALPEGVVMPYTGTSAPAFWLLCNGSAVSRTTYSALFAITGVTYGVGNGSTTFNLPDIRGRVIAGHDTMGLTSANRLTNPATTVGGINGDTLGGTGGEETHTPTIEETFAHQHGALMGSGSSPQGGSVSSSRNYGNGDSYVLSPNNGGGSAYADTQFSGDSVAHNNVQPTIILNYIIYAGV